MITKSYIREQLKQVKDPEIPEWIDGFEQNSKFLDIGANIGTISLYAAKKGIESIQNDFESSVFQSFPEIQDLKNALLSAGAFYAAMSGSGSSVFALFEMDVVINLPEEVDQYVIYKGSWRF